MDARVGLAAQVIIGLQQDLKEACEIFLGKLFRGSRESRALVWRRGDQLRIRSANACYQEISDVANRFAAEML